MYTGGYVMRRMKVRKKDCEIVSSEYLPIDKQPIVANHHEPLVSKALFKKVQGLRAERGEHWPGAACRKEGWCRNGS